MKLKKILNKLKERFPDVPITAWKRHTNGGGWVADTAQVDERAFIGKECYVFGYAIIGPEVRLYKNVIVSDTVCLNGKCYINCESLPGRIELAGNTKIRDVGYMTGCFRVESNIIQPIKHTIEHIGA